MGPSINDVHRLEGGGRSGRLLDGNVKKIWKKLWTSFMDGPHAQRRNIEKILT